MKRVGYYVAHMKPPYHGHESGDIGGTFESEEKAVQYARSHVRNSPLGIYRVHSRRTRRDLVRTVYPQNEGASVHHAAKHTYQYRAVVGGKGILLGGTKRHASSWFKTKKEADDWAWAIHEGNEAVGRSVAYVTIERKHDGVVEHVKWAHAGEVEV